MPGTLLAQRSNNEYSISSFERERKVNRLEYKKAGPNVKSLDHQFWVMTPLGAK